MARANDPSASSVELPAAVAQAVAEGSFPAEIRLAGWSGPTLFTSEISGGRLPRLSAFVAAAPDGDDPIVLGTVRETELSAGEGPVRYAAFCLDPAGERVILVDFQTGERKAVNSGVPQMIRCLALFEREWNTFAKLHPDEIDPFLEWLRGALKGLDPQAFRGREDYWSSWLGLLAEQKEE